VVDQHMENKETLEKLRRHQDVLRTIAYLCTDSSDLGRILDSVVIQVSRAVEVDHVKILRYRPGDSDLLVVAGVGWRDGVVGHATFSVDLSSPPGAAFQTGDPVIIPELSKSKEFRTSGVLAEHGIISVLNVPIQVDDAAWGILEVDSTVLRDFSEDTLSFLTTVGSILSSAIRREQMSVAHESSIGQLAVQSARLELFIGEMQHRMKNNFQIILSMISLRRRNASEMVDAVLEQLADNVIGMSLAHDQLAVSKARDSIRLASYLRVLANRIQMPLERVSVEVHAEDFDVPIEQAVPLGLVMNELITNSGKHAFKNKPGVVRVDLARAGRGELQLVVSDNGSGAEFAKSSGTGLKLVESLARHIRGRVNRSSSKEGTAITIFFPSP
jgi:two-component system, sensor histidine kinase PdtaS